MRRYFDIAPLLRHATKEAFSYGESHDSNEGSSRTDGKGHD